MKELYVSAVNALLSDKKEIIANFTSIHKALFDTSELEAERTSLQAELAVTSDLIQKYIDENARVAIAQNSYQQHYSELVSRFNAAQAKIDELTAQISTTIAQGKSIAEFIAELKKQDDLITEFDDGLWYNLLSYVTVYNERDVRFVFKDGTEITLDYVPKYFQWKYE
jgi:chromosome condensin MukBEF ATPase and DNA-binding subunit MukB